MEFSDFQILDRFAPLGKNKQIENQPSQLVQPVQTPRIFKWLEANTGAGDHEGENVEQGAGGDTAMWEVSEDEISPRNNRASALVRVSKAFFVFSNKIAG